jgi:Sortase domain
MKVELRRTTGWAGIVLGVTLVAVALIPALPWNGSRSVASLAPSATSSREAEGPPVTAAVASPSQTRHGSVVADPQRITIPRINLSASVVPVGLQPDGSLAAPVDFSLAGWYMGGAAPGAPGPSVIVGHIDSQHGPAVFFRLPELVPGQSIVIDTVKDATFTFIVERIEQYPKDRFPTAEVYGFTNQRALRLITCGGEFDRTVGSYRDNIVVFASLAE